MKLVIMPLAIPFVFIAAVFGIALSPLYAICFALFYPGIVTVDIKRQSAWRRTWLWAGWSETFITTQENLITYFYVCTKGVPDELRKLRRRTYTKRQEIYPLDWIVAIVFFFCLGGVLSAVSMAIIIAVKLPAIAYRAFSNHFRTSSDWFRSPALIFAWVLGLLLVIPLGVALAVPAALIWGIYKGSLSASMIMTRHMDVVASKASKKIDIAQAESLSGSFSYYVDSPLDSLLTSVKNVHVESTRYILRQDVPFLVLESSNPVSVPWLAFGLVASVIGVICVIPIMLTIILMSIVPVLMSMWGKLIQFMSTSNGQRAYTFPFALLGLVLAIPAAPLSLLGCFLIAILNALGSFLVVHSKRSLIQGIQYALGVNYMWEYKINKFAFAMHNGDQVHWASVLPYAFGLWAMPYMDSADWDQGGAIYPIGIVVRQPRFLPPGLRRPKLSTDGRVLDMTSAAYKIPGGTASMPDPSITQIAVDGSLRMPVPLHEMKPLPICYDGGKNVHPFSTVGGGAESEKKPLYGVELLPGAYRAALFELAKEAMRLAAKLPDDVSFAAVIASAPNAQAVASAFSEVLREQPVHNDTVSHSAFDLIQNQGGLPPLLVGVSLEDGHELEIMARSAGLHHAHMLQYLANQALRQIASPKKPQQKRTKTLSPAAKRRELAAASSSSSSSSSNKANNNEEMESSPTSSSKASTAVNVAAVDNEDEEEEEEEEDEVVMTPPIIAEDEHHINVADHEAASPAIQAQQDVHGFMCCSCMHHDGYDDYDDDDSKNSSSSSSSENALEEASAAIAASNSPVKQASSKEFASSSSKAAGAAATGGGSDLQVSSDGLREVGKRKVESLKTAAAATTTLSAVSESNGGGGGGSRPSAASASSSLSLSSSTNTALLNQTRGGAGGGSGAATTRIDEEDEDDEEEDKKRTSSANAAIEEANKALTIASSTHQAAMQMRATSEGSIGVLAVSMSSSSLQHTEKPELDVSRISSTGIRAAQSSAVTTASTLSSGDMLPRSLASTPSSSSSSSIPTSAYAPASVTASPPHIPAPPLSPRSHHNHDSDNDDKDEVDEDDEPFVLSAVTHPELPDVWVKVGGEGANAYFVNYARAQSAWKLPEGLPIKI